MHAVIRILCLLVFSVAVVYGGPIDLLLAFLLLVILYSSNTTVSWQAVWQSLGQIRWLLLTIIILYSWMTPGQALIPQYANYSPSQEGVLMGLERCLALVFMLAAVYWVLHSMARQELLAALLFLLSVVPVSAEKRARVAVRIMLSLELLPRIRERISTSMKQLPESRNNSWYQVSWLAKFFDQWLLEIEQEEPVWIELPTQKTIPVWQWSYPLLLGIAFCLLATYV